jgi:hypothetical protein
MILTLTSIASAVFAANMQINVVVVARIARVCAAATNKLAFVAKHDVALATRSKLEICAALFVLRVLGFNIAALFVVEQLFVVGFNIAFTPFLGINAFQGIHGSSRHFVRRSRRRKSH